MVTPDKPKDIYTAYADCISTSLDDLEDNSNLYDDDNYYFLYDITGDGSPELWIVISNSITKIERGLTVYTYDKGHCKSIFADGGVVYTDIGIGDKCVVCESGVWGAGGGIDRKSILTYDGHKIIETFIKVTEEWEILDDPDGGYETKVTVDKTDEYLPIEVKSPKTAKLSESYKLTNGSYFK